jgi:hypothetical protein
MFEMRLKEIIPTIVNFAFDSKKPDLLNLLRLSFDVRMYDYECNKHTRTEIDLAFYRREESRYTCVFYSLNNNKTWANVTNHDECWRDIPIITQVYFDMAEFLNKNRQAQNLPELAPKDFHSTVNFNNFSDKMWEWVPNFTVAKDPTDPFNYRRILTIA